MINKSSVSENGTTSGLSDSFGVYDIVNSGPTSQFGVGTFRQTLNGQIVRFDPESSETAITDIAIVDYRSDKFNFINVNLIEIVEILEIYYRWITNPYRRYELNQSITVGRFDFDLSIYNNMIFDLTDDSFTDLFNALNTYLNNRFN